MSNTIVSVKPEFGVNYKMGYVGFIFTDDSFISKGIAWFTRWDKGASRELPVIDVSHVVIVTGENECIEATTPAVKKTPLSYYFDDPHAHISFRKPVGMTDEIAKRMIAIGETKLGKRYDYFLILGHLICNTCVGQILEKIFGYKIKEIIVGFFHNRQAYICSEFAAFCLDSMPEYKDKGILIEKEEAINPQELFQDMSIFERWAEVIKGSLS